MSTRMLCSALRCPVPDPSDAVTALMVRQLSMRAKDAADMIERLCAAVRDANDLDIEAEISTDDMLEHWREKHLHALADATNF